MFLYVVVVDLVAFEMGVSLRLSPLMVFSFGFFGKKRSPIYLLVVNRKRG